MKQYAMIRIFHILKIFFFHFFTFARFKFHERVENTIELTKIVMQTFTMASKREYQIRQSNMVKVEVKTLRGRV